MSTANDGKGGGDKKRLKVLMPEILPDPTPQHAEGGPRARTMATMQRLLGVAAATSMIAGVACTKDDGQTSIKKEDEVAKKPDQTKTATPPTTVESTTASATASTTTVASVPTVPTVPTGYMVVDPMPPPAKCAGTAASIKPTATWKSGGGGAMYIELRMPKPTRADAHYGRTSPPTAYSGKLISVTFVGDDALLRIVPDAAATYTGVYMPAECSAGPERINAELTWTGTPTPGAPVTVNLYDSY